MEFVIARYKMNAHVYIYVYVCTRMYMYVYMHSCVFKSEYIYIYTRAMRLLHHPVIDFVMMFVRIRR